MANLNEIQGVKFVLRMLLSTVLLLLYKPEDTEGDVTRNLRND